MSELTCLRCRNPFDAELNECPHCGETVTDFQRSYSQRYLDGKYELLYRLGLGGMGEIFKVRHVHLGEERVVKIMRPNIATDDDALKRFLHEARLATMVKHRNLAMLYDFATLEDGSYYMVWEFIDGSNVQSWIQENGPMPPRIVVEVTIQALAGLEALHQMGVIHRDISPENIMITQDFHEKLLCKVIDFGIAKSLSEGESGQGLTQTGMFLGKLKYASPEQAGFLKEGEHLDARSDIYSFGIVMYEMLAGRAPFVSTNPQSYILKHATEKPVPISEINPNVKVPPELEEIVFQTLEKDRLNRPESAAALIEMLEQIREQIPPDEKLGVGEKLVTISQAKTMVDLSAPVVTGRMTKKTKAGKPSDSDATVIERKESSPTMSGDATVIEPGGKAATMSGDATVVERAAEEPAPTLIEHIEKSKKKTGLYIAIAALIIATIAAGAYFMTRPAEDSGTTPGETVEVTTGETATGLLPGEGALLVASSNGRLQKVIDTETSVEIPLDVEDRSLPIRLHLAAGEYELTLESPTGETTTRIARVSEGTEARIRPNFTRSVDIDDLVDDILAQ